MKIDVQTITPAHARAMLAHNVNNRSLRPEHVRLLARDMAAGNWQINGDAIRIGKDGELLDGQHRLEACVKSNTRFQTLVITGLDDEVKNTIDGGAKRTYGDRLSLRGIQHANHVSAALRMMAAIAEKQVTPASYTIAELDRVLARHPGIEHSAGQAHKIKIGGIHATLAAVHYIGTFLGRDDEADRFLDVFRTGIPDYTGCAAHYLREKIIRTENTSSALPINFKRRAAVHAWGVFCDQRPVKVLRAPDRMEIRGWDEDALGMNPQT